MTKIKAKTEKKVVKQTRKCAVCNKAFKPAVHNEKYCSDECYKKAKKARQAAKNNAKAAKAVKPANVVKQVAKPAKPVVGKKCSCHCVETLQIKKLDGSKVDNAIIKRMEKTLSNLYTHMYGIIMCFDELVNSFIEHKKIGK